MFELCSGLLVEGFLKCKWLSMFFVVFRRVASCLLSSLLPTNQWELLCGHFTTLIFQWACDSDHELMQKHLHSVMIRDFHSNLTPDWLNWIFLLKHWGTYVWEATTLTSTCLSFLLRPNQSFRLQKCPQGGVVWTCHTLSHESDWIGKVESSSCSWTMNNGLNATCLKQQQPHFVPTSKE